MHIILPLPLRWILRLGLAIFYGAGIWEHLHGKDFFGWLVRDHIYITTMLAFLTIVAFTSPFVRIKRKTHDGGEKEMRKLAWFVIIVFAVVLAVAIGCAVNDSFKTSVADGLVFVFGSIWTLLSSKWSELATFMGTSGTYFLIYTISTLFIGGALFVGLSRLRSSGRLPSLRGTASTSPSTAARGSSTPSMETHYATSSTPKSTANPSDETEEVAT